MLNKKLHGKAIRYSDANLNYGDNHLHRFRRDKRAAFLAFLVCLFVCGCSQLSPELFITSLPQNDPVAKTESQVIHNGFTMTTDDVRLPRDLDRFADIPFYIFLDDDSEVQFELYYDFLRTLESVSIIVKTIAALFMSLGTTTLRGKMKDTFY